MRFTVKQGKYVDFALVIAVMVFLKYAIESGLKEEKLARQEKEQTIPVSKTQFNEQPIILMIYDPDKFKSFLFKHDKVPAHDTGLELFHRQ